MMFEASDHRPQSFKSAILLAILENGLKLDIYDKKYFLLYLENPLKMWHMNKKRGTKDCQDFTWNPYFQNLQVRQGGVMSSELEGNMYKKYLEYFYRDTGDLKEFQDYFSDKFLKSLAEELSFLAGNDIPKTDKVDFEKYEKLKNTVIIELLKSNKEVFKPGDRIEIVTELKNVPTMHVKIFEFNSLNYYKKHFAPFKTDVNLDGLITTFEKTVHFNEIPAQKKFLHTFEFPELDDKIGLYIIEFISNGYSSRAIIKKGTLSIIYKQRISGQIAYILDDERNVCIGEDTGIFFRNQFFKADPEKGGRILIPYEKKTVSSNAILVHHGFAQLVEFTRFAEKYTLDIAYLINPESLIMGNQASIILRPCLKINQRKCVLDPLSKTKASITTTSFIDNVPITKNFDELVLKNNKDLELNFSVPANLETVTIDFETCIFNISNQKVEKLRSSHKVNMKTNNHELTFYESHLKKLQGKYFFYVLGKNGEPISNVDVLFSMTHCIYNGPNKQIQLTTDDEGLINLGNLDGIKQVNSQIYLSTTPLNGTWQLSNTTQKNTFPEKIEILQNEDIEFPFIKAVNDSDFSEDTFAFIRMTHNNRHIENCFHKAKFTPAKGGTPALVKLSELEPGYYTIAFKE